MLDHPAEVRAAQGVDFEAVGGRIAGVDLGDRRGERPGRCRSIRIVGQVMFNRATLAANRAKMPLSPLLVMMLFWMPRAVLGGRPATSGVPLLTSN